MKSSKPHSAPLTNAPTTKPEPRLRAGLAAGLCLLLLGMSAALAHLPLALPYSDYSQKVNLGLRLLMFDAIPWLLQYGALALFVFLLNRWLVRASRRQLKDALPMPLLLGVMYWIWTVIKYWRYASPLEFVSETILTGVAQNLGAAPSFAATLRRFLQDTVSPCQIGEPFISLQGWNFALAGLSTLAILIYWLLATKWIGEREPQKRATKIQVAKMALVLLLYLLPFIIDGFVSLLKLRQQLAE